MKSKPKQLKERIAEGFIEIPDGENFFTYIDLLDFWNTELLNLVDEMHSLLDSHNKVQQNTNKKHIST